MERFRFISLPTLKRILVLSVQTSVKTFPQVIHLYFFCTGSRKLELSMYPSSSNNSRKIVKKKDLCQVLFASKFFLKSVSSVVQKTVA